MVYMINIDITDGLFCAPIVAMSWGADGEQSTQVVTRDL